MLSICPRIIRTKFYLIRHLVDVNSTLIPPRRLAIKKKHVFKLNLSGEPYLAVDIIHL